jgi:hypothetical protein
MATTTYRDFTVEVSGVEAVVHLITEDGVESVEVEIPGAPALDFSLRGTPNLPDLVAQIDRVLFTG